MSQLGEDREKKNNTISGISIIRGLIARLSERRKLTETKRDKRLIYCHYGVSLDANVS